jgi:cyclophilin family peptidyl-prolyl cis-trans isomerase
MFASKTRTIRPHEVSAVISSSKLRRLSLATACLVGSMSLAGIVASQDDTKAAGAAKEGGKIAPAKVDPSIAILQEFIKSKEIDTQKAGWKTSLPRPPKVKFETLKQSYFWNIETNKGLIKVRLRTDVAPMHASSTIYLTLLGFYDGLTFHRVIKGFMAQGGCPQGTGRGGPGYKYAGEFSRRVKHDKPGLLSMANSGPNTDGSQFFLTFVPTPHLDGKHTIFGEVVSGMPVLKVLERLGSGSGRTSEPLMMKKCTITVESPMVPTIAAFKKHIASKNIDKTKPKWKTTLPEPPTVAAFDEKKDYFWTLKTNKGDIKIKMMPQVAPKHVASTMYLTLLGYYDEVKFHRVMTNFMAQGGCPLGTGTGGPGYEYGGEFSPNVKHDRAGLLSMANRGPGTDGSQFFLTFVATPWLDNKHTIFGEIVEGMENLRKLEAAGSQGGRTTESLSIKKAEFTIVDAAPKKK